MKKHTLFGGRTAIIMTFLFLLLFLGGKYSALAADVETQKEDGTGRVLFISSYSYSWETVPQQMEGIKEELGNDVVLDYKFMDTKNVNTEENVRLFYESMKYYLQNVAVYNVVIVGDDAAFNFVLEYKEELFDGIPIIFEGVNNVEKAKEASKSREVSGVIESLSYDNTIALASEMYPEATQVVAVLDNTVTGEGERTEFFKYDSKFPELKFKEINASELSQNELKRQVAELGEESILLYIMCSEDGDGNVYASEEAVEMLCTAANIPMYSIVSIGMGKGFLGGEIVSQKQMGRIAGQMAAQILEGKDCGEIELVDNSPKMYCFDENVMKRFNIDRSSLPDNVEIINHEADFFERNKDVIMIAFSIVVFLLILIGILTVDNVRKRRMNDVINETNEKLAYTAQHDSLTQLLNRQTFMEDLQKKIAAGEPFGVIMYDLDNFKRINDKYGHNEGDAMLKELSARSEKLCDEHFMAYRLAGDEFVAIVSGVDAEGFESYAKALQNAIQEPYQLTQAEERMYSSIGIAMWPNDGKDGMDLISAADKAMYYIKRYGKNGIAFYEDGM